MGSGESFQSNNIEQTRLMYYHTSKGLDFVLIWLKLQIESATEQTIIDYYNLIKSKVNFYITYFETTPVDQIDFTLSHQDVKLLFNQLQTLKSERSIMPLDYLLNSLSILNNMIQ